MNGNGKDILKNSITAAAGLFIFGFGVYLTIQAGIGAAPWDAFNLGLSKVTGISYGTASITVSFVILFIDMLLREKIGIGMILDAVIVGKAVDLFNYLDLVKTPEDLFLSVVIMTAGMFIMGFSQVIYMKTGLGCGPRDSMLVGLKRRLAKIPIGIVSVAILTAVTLIGWLLGGPIGIGTLICAFLEGPVMQLDFRIAKFDPTAVSHQDILTSLKVLTGRQ